MRTGIGLEALEGPLEQFCGGAVDGVAALLAVDRDHRRATPPVVAHLVAIERHEASFLQTGPETRRGPERGAPEPRARRDLL